MKKVIVLSFKGEQVAVLAGAFTKKLIGKLDKDNPLNNSYELDVDTAIAAVKANPPSFEFDEVSVVFEDEVDPDFNVDHEALAQAHNEKHMKTKAGKAALAYSKKKYDAEMAELAEIEATMS